MSKEAGSYQDVYIKRQGEMVSLKDDVRDFCEKYIMPVHPMLWDWSNEDRDFEKPENDPTIAEARAIRDVIFKDMSAFVPTAVDLTTIDNVKSIKAYLDPKSKYEEFNMEEFAYALKVELEHGRVKAANVTNNHPFLTAMIALAHMSETLTYYKRLKVMETEGEIFELKRKLEAGKGSKDKLQEELAKAEKELVEARQKLKERLEKMDDIPVQDKIGD
jgi:hypothetical protein